MGYITGTDIPANAFVLCPRCHVIRNMTGLADDLQFFCTGCEWAMTMGAGSSPLSTNAAITAGTTTALPFASGGTQFAAGQLLFINDAALSETVLVSGTSSATSVPVTPFANSHASGKAVTVAVASPTLSGQDAVPPAPGWGF